MLPGGGTEAESGVSEQAEAPRLKGGETIDDEYVAEHGNTFTMSGRYNKNVKINAPNSDIVIDITAPITFDNAEGQAQTDADLIRAFDGKTLTINNKQNYLVNCIGSGNRWGSAFLRAHGSNTVTVNGGEYKSDKRETIFNHTKAIYLYDVTATSNREVINNYGYMEVHGGKITLNGDDNDYYPIITHNTSTWTDCALKLYNTDVVSESENPSSRCIFNAGKVEINGGNYTSEYYIVTDTWRAETIINSGKFTSNKGQAAIYGRGKVDIKGGNFSAPAGSAVKVAYDQDGSADSSYVPTAELTGGSIENSKNGIEVLAGSVTLGNAAFAGNENDIYLASGKKITVKDTFTGCATVKVEDPAEGRVITTNTAKNQDKLNLTSNDLDNTGRNYVVAYDSENNDLVLRKGYRFTVNNATAKTESKKLALSETVVEGTGITATPAEKPGYQFTGWTAEGIELEDKTAVPLTITMPANDVTLTANYEEATEPVPSDPVNTDPADDGSGIAGAIVTGGVLAWGAYEAGTGIYRTVNMRGIPLPSNRAELALLIWEKADEPEPESAELYTDIDEDDTDLQKAARWMVEQELMKDQDGRFWPELHVSKLRVCTTWEQAKQKGLIQ